MALRLFLDPGGGQSSFGGLFAMAVLAIGPVLGFFLASQRYLVQGVATQASSTDPRWPASPSTN